MGYAVSWLAIRGKSPGTVLEELGFRIAGQRQAVPEFPVVQAMLPNDWQLIFANDFGFASGVSLAQLSSGAEIVTCSLEEHVMQSTASAWRDGVRVWQVTHEFARGLEDLTAEGDLPASFAAIRGRLFQEQAESGEEGSGIDMVFDIPIELARSVTGYQHDRDIPGAGEKPFEKLE